MCLSKRPSAKMNETTMILSLPDAMTPVVWMIDMYKEGSFVMKVENAEGGTYVLQKISADGKTIDDIAYYDTQKRAIRAMNVVTKAIGKGAGQSFWKTGFAIVKTAFLTLATIVFIGVIGILLSESFANWVFGNDDNDAQAYNTGKVIQDVPQIETNPDTVGVPMSADDFLEQKGSSTFPF